MEEAGAELKSPKSAEEVGRLWWWGMVRINAGCTKNRWYKPKIKLYSGCEGNCCTFMNSFYSISILLPSQLF